MFDSDSPSAALRDGRAEVGIVWSGEAALLWQADHRFQYVVPVEGGHRFVDSLAIPKGAPHRQAAERFLNYCLSGEVGAKIATAYPYTSPNAAARRLLKSEQLANPASYAPATESLPMLHNQGLGTKEIEAWMKRLRNENQD